MKMDAGRSSVVVDCVRTKVVVFSDAGKPAKESDTGVAYARGAGLDVHKTVSAFCAVRFHHPIRVLNPREIPTDHDCAVPTRGYRSDQPSHLPLFLSPALPLSRLARLSRTKNTAGLDCGSKVIMSPLSKVEMSS